MTKQSLPLHYNIYGSSFTGEASSSHSAGKIESDGTSEEINEKVILDPETSTSEERNISFNRATKRVFPGPAGLVSDPSKSKKSRLELVSDNHVEADGNILLCSQFTAPEFEVSPWREMKKDFSVQHGEQLYEKFDINWIKKKTAQTKMVVSFKAPFLASVIHSIEVIEGKIPTINVTLKDTSGVINGTVSLCLYEEHGAYLTVGSVVVLKESGILSVGDSYLTITPTNLLTIYYLVVPSDNEPKLVRKINVQQICIEEIWKMCNEYSKENLKHQKSPNFRKNLDTSVKNVDHSLNCISPFTKRNVGLRRSMGSEINMDKVTLRMENKIISSPGNNMRKFGLERTSDSFPAPNMKVNISDNGSDNISIKCSEIIVQSAKDHTEIWKNLFEEVDADSLFDEF
ncbi:hypothetical protein JTB14_023175 [Gonioctena quinquepunctata]|nr:hypothetical protein JTB14_023175 [Gonioctena quinquepunctata]